MQIPEGTIVDSRFRIGLPLGSGAIGAVYEAIQLDLERPVAIKFLKDSAMRDAEDVARFHREAQILSALKHRNIVSVYAFGHWGGAYYMVIERVDGRSLDEQLEPKKPLPLDFVFDTISQVCDGLAAAHARDIVHRDIKPSNVIISKSGDVKIIDFGFAKDVSPSQQSQQLTEVGTAVGTVLYMSPEQCNAQKVDHRADIYSTGAMLYHCLTGHAPFLGEDYLTVMRKQINDPVPRLGKQFSEELQNVVDNAMAKKRDERYQSIKDMRDDLERAKRDQPVALRTMTNATPALVAPPKDKRKVFAIAVAASFVLSIGMLFYFGRHTGMFHDVSEEQADMLSLLRTQETRLKNEELRESDKHRKGELFAEITETLIRIADISANDRKQYLDEAEHYLRLAVGHMELLDQPAMIDRLSSAFKSTRGNNFRYLLLAEELDVARLRASEKPKSTRDLLLRVLDVSQNDPQSEAAENVQIAAMIGVLQCDKALGNREEWPGDIDRCTALALREPITNAGAVERLAGIANLIAELNPKSSKQQLSLIQKLDKALRAGGEMDKDYHQLTRSYVFTAGGYVRNNEYKPALELMKLARQYVAKSNDKQDADMYNHAIKEWKFPLEPLQM